MPEQNSREIQLTGKQLIFLFMSAIVLLVVVFLLGVSLGRGVGSERLAGPAGGDSQPGDTTVPAAPAAADDPVALSYPNQLTGRGESTPAVPPTPPDELPPITPPGVAAAEVVEDVPSLSPPPVASGGWIVQVGAYRSRDGADRVVRDLVAKGYQAFVSPSGGLNRVRVGPFAEQEAADAAAAEIERLGHPKPKVQKEGQ